MVDTPIYWTDPNSNETGYNLHRSEVDIRADILGDPTAAVAANAASFVDTTPERTKTYNYRVASVKSPAYPRKEWVSPQVKKIAGDWDIYLDFEKDRTWDKLKQSSPSLSDMLKDTANSACYIPAPNGEYVLTPANALAKTAQGLWSFPSRSNALPNSSMVGAEVGNPGVLPNSFGATASNGWAFQIAGKGTENGFPYTDITMTHATGASGNAFINLCATSGSGATPATTGQTWAVSTFVQLVGGSTQNITKIDFTASGRLSNGSGISGQGAITANLTELAVKSRIAVVTTFTDPTVAYILPYITINPANSGPISVTLRISAPQAELGNYASAPILTSNVSVSRTGSKITLDLTGRLGYGAAGYIKLKVLPDLSNSVAKFFTFSNNTSTERYFLGPLSTAIGTGVVTNNSLVSSLSASEFAPGEYTIAFAAGPNFRRVSVLGASTSPAQTNAITWPAIDRLVIGGRWNDYGENSYQLTKKFGLILGAPHLPINQALFDRVVTMATEESIGAPTLI